ncbi:lipopolysaccharide biosynthesis protein [Roseimaritima ulvae]|uniref:Polysaccharide biosynthesis protein n=1 Tax=Roseimaritima ulvae TaxID=980254 RepID=A0A5B9QS85_9BACT|nr:hypothetical protein [Roseimaritima ulvae]QEG40235.1 Polysaccharide biosynthesis protein [Roseimaritima ulvae]
MAGITRTARHPLAEPREHPPQRSGGLGGLLSVSGTFLTSFMLFGWFAVQGIVLARMLGPEGRGGFAATIAYPQMLLYLGLLGAADLFARRAARWQSNDAPLRRAALRYGGLTGTLTMLASGLLILIAMPEDKRSLIPLALLVAATLPFQHVRLAVQAVDHGCGRLNRYNASRLLAAAAPPFALAVAWVAGLRSLQGAVYVYAAAMFVSVGLVHWGMRQSWWGEASPSTRTALREGRGFAGSQVVAELLDRADVGLILWLGTLLEQGFYAAAVPIAGTMAIVPMAVATYTFRHGAVGQRPFTTRQATVKLGVLSLAQLISGLALAAVLPVVIPLLYGPDFAPAVVFVWWLLPAAALRGVVIAVDGYLRGRNRSRPGIVARVIALLVLLGCSAGLYSQWGVYAIPFSLGIAQAVATLLVVVAMYGEVGQRDEADLHDAADQKDVNVREATDD